MIKVRVGDDVMLIKSPEDYPALFASLIAYGLNPAIIALDEASVTEWQKRRSREAVRAVVAETAGDTETMLGTMTDAVQILLYGVAQIVRALSTAQSLAEVRASAEPFAALSGSFLAKVEAGTVRLPFMAKGFDSAVADIEQRSTAVADAIASMTPVTLEQSAVS